SSGDRTTYVEANVTYDRVFGRHRVGALFLYNHREYRNLAAGNAEASLFYRNQGLAARVSYSFDDRYFFEANMGYNGSENFSPGNRFGFFPAVAAGWIVTNESFMEGAKETLSLLKLKASYGKAGNDKIGGDRRFIYNSTILTKDIPGYTFGSTGQTGFGGIRIGEVANPNVGWEKSTKLNLGVEIGLFNALKITADYFSDERTGICSRRGSGPGIVGVPLDNLPMVNVAESKNRGFDSTVEYDKVFGDWQISGQGSFTFNVNEVINNEEPDWKYTYLNRIGQAVGQPFGLVSDGLFESEADIANSPKQTFTSVVRPGDIKYRDINGDGKIDTNDQIAIGRPALPQIIYGFAATASYKGIQLGIRFQGVARTSMFLSGSAVRPFSNNSLGRSNFHSYIYDNHWTETNPNPNAEFPRTTAGSNDNNNRQSTYWMRDAGFLRIKDVELRYNFARRICEKMKLRGLSIYATGNNLATFSKFKLWDPEIGGGQGNAYPLMRTYNIGITISY
ncbi:MAG: SusC/RagA family TonB-linked outer membrane protein, partial [Rikenellaceae bacterium]